MKFYGAAMTCRDCGKPADKLLQCYSCSGKHCLDCVKKTFRTHNDNYKGTPELKTYCETCCVMICNNYTCKYHASKTATVTKKVYDVYGNEHTHYRKTGCFDVCYVCRNNANTHVTYDYYGHHRSMPLCCVCANKMPKIEADIKDTLALLSTMFCDPSKVVAEYWDSDVENGFLVKDIKSNCFSRKDEDAFLLMKHKVHYYDDWT
jgi:hypothetical protein